MPVVFDHGFRVATYDIGTATSSGYFMCEVPGETDHLPKGVNRPTLTGEEKALLAKGEPVVLTFDAAGASGKRERLIPSVVDFGEGGPHVGALAKENMDSPNVVYLPKRLLGLSLEEAREKHPDLCARFNVSAKDSSNVYFNLENGTKVDPSEVLAHIAETLVAETTRKTGCEPTWVAASVPAYFSKNQRELTKQYIKSVLPKEVCFLGVLDEPTAAALAYGADSLIERSEPGKRLFNLVVDLGGGTFDVSLIQYKCSGSSDQLHVFDKRGDLHLGGRDFDLVLRRMYEKKLIEARKGTRELDAIARKQLDNQVEAARVYLTKDGPMGDEYVVTVDSMGKRTEAAVTRRAFLENEETVALLKKCENLVEKLLDQEGVGKVSLTEIDTVILVGGASYMHPFRQTISSLLHIELSALKSVSDPETAVAYGCMKWALSEIKAKKDSPDDEERFQAVDAVAAMPAVVQDQTHYKLVECLPFPLGISCRDKDGNTVFSPLLPRGASYNSENEKDYRTVYDDATEVTIRVREGDEKDAAKFENIHEFRVSGIPPRTIPGKTGAIKIRFRMTESRELKVHVFILDTPDVPAVVETVKRGGLNYTKEEADLIQLRMEAQAEARKLSADKKRVRLGISPIIDLLYTLVAGQADLRAEVREFEAMKDLITNTDFDLIGFIKSLRLFIDKARSFGPSAADDIESQLGLLAKG